MKKHKTISRTEALAEVNTISVARYTAPQGRETLSSFTREYDAAEQRKKDAEEQTRFAPVKAAEQQLTETLRKLRAEQAQALFNVESTELMSRCTNIEEDQFAGKTIQECRALILGAFDAARLALEDQGIRLEASALQKLDKIKSQNRKIDWTNPLNWKSAFDYADEIGVFSDHDVIRREVAAQQTQPVVEEPIDIDSAIEQLDTTTRDGQRRAHNLLASHLFSVDAKSVFDEWIASLSNNFDFIPTEEKQRAAIELFIERNLSFLSRKSYDDVRKVLVARGMFPERCLTNEDRAAILVEATDARSYQERQDLKAKLALLREGKHPL